jgi:hypothetical protein
VRNWAERDYDNRIGIWRLMEVSSRYGIRVSAALNSEVCDHHLEIIEEGGKLGWEWIGHNQTNALRLTEMDPAGSARRYGRRSIASRWLPARARSARGGRGIGEPMPFHTGGRVKNFTTSPGTGPAVTFSRKHLRESAFSASASTGPEYHRGNSGGYCPDWLRHRDARYTKLFSPDRPCSR